MLQYPTLVAVLSSAVSRAQAELAAGALRDFARRRGQSIRIEVSADNYSSNVLTEAEIAAADLVLIAADRPIDRGRFVAKQVVEAPLSGVIRQTEHWLDGGMPREEPPAAFPPTRLVAITSCPTGIAHTFLAAESLKKAAVLLGYELRVETQGSVGAKNVLTSEEIAAAEVVIIAADTNIDLGRFAGKRIHQASTKDAIRGGPQMIRTALAQAIATVSGPRVAAAIAPRPARSGAYKHLMTGVSHMLPVVVAGGLAIALAFATAGIYAAKETGSLGAALNQIGGAAFLLIIPILSGFIAWSIAERPGLAPGLIGGMLAQQSGAGFLGALASGFLAGYLTRFLNRRIPLPEKLEGLKPVLILPLLASLGTGLVMIYLVAPPAHTLLVTAAGWLDQMRGTNALLLGMILGAMMAFDMGGPINKAAYTFAVGLLASKVSGPMAAVMAAGMTPPLGVAVAAFLFPRRFDADERKASGAALVLGLAFITEGAIPFAAKDPLRVIPALMLGSAAAGGLSMLAGVHLWVPHGGVFAAMIPGAVTHVLAYLGAIVVGTVLTASALSLLKRPSHPAEPRFSTT